MILLLAEVALYACAGGLSSRPLPPAEGPSATDSQSPEETETRSDDTSTPTDTGTPAPCPDDMVALDGFCMDRYEAPNQAGALPLVMYTLVESEAWCSQREKRLCFDDEWLSACEGSAGTDYPYGEAHEPGVCNDEEIWRTYSQSSLSLWPSSASSPDIDSLDALLAAASASSEAAAQHVAWLYQAEASGSNTGCTNETGVFDLTGNVEEWTLRRDGGTTSFTGNLKGRYWSETRTCGSNLTSHGDTFRFYEIGFRCCQDF